MTILATAMGCTFLIVLASVAFGLHDTLLQDYMEHDRINEIEVYGTSDPGRDTMHLTNEDINYFESLDHVKTVRRSTTLQQYPLMSIDNYQLATEAKSVYYPAEQEAGFTLTEGRFPEQDNEVIVGYHFASLLAPTNNDNEELYDDYGLLKEAYQYDGPIVGDTFSLEIEKIDQDGAVEIGKFDVIVSGIVEQPKREWFTESTVYISEQLLTDIEAFTETTAGSPYIEYQEGPVSDERTYSDIVIHSTTIQYLQDLTEKLAEENYYVYSVASQVQQMNLLFNIAKAGLIFIGTIAILIASIGIYNTMTMAVTERAGDIGIMKAIGANPKTIKQIFLIESSYIGLLGAFFGTVVAYLLSHVVNWVIPVILESAFDDTIPEGFKFSSIPFVLVLITILICLAVTLISGSQPAKRATQVDVLKAMRREI